MQALRRGFLAKTLDSVYCSPRCSKIAWNERRKEKL